DAKALYIGGNMFDSTGTVFLGTNGYVVNKASLLGGGPIVVTAFPGLTPSASLDGPSSPRGVDNFDPASNEGYFIGNSNVFLGSLVARRISDPGGLPTISPNLFITVNATDTPTPVAHLGNTGGNNGRLDAIDDRLFAAHIRNGRLWTAHDIGVLPTGVAGGTSGAGGTKRDAVRWYELSGVRSTDNGGVPVVVESGTIFDTSATVTTARQFWMPTVMVSGQGHAAIGFSTAGTPFRADAATAGRLSDDPLSVTGNVAIYTSSATAYNPAGNPGGSGGRRWGDYSFTSLDPLDDMTMWTIQEFCNATNSYGIRAVKLLAPPPAAPISAPGVPTGLASMAVVLTGLSTSGSGFYDPGPDLPAPALPFHHLSVSVTNTGVTGNAPSVNSAHFIDPTHLQLDLNTTAADPNLPGEKYSVTVTNPDGQSVNGSMVLEVAAASTAVGANANAFRLESVIPNPTTGATRIAFSVAFQTAVRLSIVDIQGREIALLADGVLPAGRHEIEWNGRRGASRAPAGIYFVRYLAGGRQQIRRLAMMH
ncbi:MAG: T9SS type A sorting domain-containing protein, partial [Candidatus Eiseniibacteriota bacterium]